MPRRRGPPSASPSAHHLVWLFNDAPGAVSGLRSSWAPLVDAAQGLRRPAPTTSPVVPQDRLEAARRETDLVARLERLDPFERTVLAAAFKRDLPWTLALDVRRRLGRWPGVAFLTSTARDGYARTVEALGERARRQAKGPKAVLAAARREAVIARGFVDWLSAARREAEPGTGTDGLLGDVRDEAATLVASALRAWAEVAPRPDENGQIRHRERRRGSMALPTLVIAKDTADVPFSPGWDLPSAGEQADAAE